MEFKAGSFCWLELGTTDQNAAKKFYSNLFGWTADEIPMGTGMSMPARRRTFAGLSKLSMTAVSLPRR